MIQLPHWVLTETFPAVYDAESDTVLTMVAKLYGAMQEQITEFNNFVDQVNNSINDFETDTTADMEQFKTCITNLMQNYIKQIDMKLDNQDTVISDAKQYMVDNITQTAQTLIAQGLSNGSIIIGLNYAPGTEDLNITGTITDGDASTHILYDADTETIEHV